MGDAGLRREAETGVPREWRESYARYRRAWKGFWISMGLGAATVVIGGLAVEVIGFDDRFLLFPFLAIFVTFAYHALRVSFWACPRCGQVFHSLWFFSNPFARLCMHCDLSKSVLE